MTENHPLREAIALVGLGPLAKSLGLTYPAIRKWERAGRMPRTEWTGETTYSIQIQGLTGGKVSASRLMGKWPEKRSPAQPVIASATAVINPAPSAQGVANV